ncbi:MAG TPA: hypothetical protein VHG88_12895 [Burkholderiales bacterium]|nr:hypothetical protein [Burkholderiales bacterium]
MLPPVFVGHDIYRQAAYGSHHWAGLWGRLCGRAVPATLSPQAQAVLQPLSCDLIDDKEVRECWRSTLADAPNRGAVRKEIHELV